MDTVTLKLNIKYVALVGGIVLALSAIAMLLIVNGKITVKEIFDIVSVSMLLVTAYYAAANVHMMRVNSNMEVQKSKRMRSADVIARWASPDMSVLVTRGSEVRNLEKSAEELMVFLKDNELHQQASFSILNFFERIGLFISYDVVDEKMLKEYFEDMVKIYWLQFEEFIKSNRKKEKLPRLFCNLESLANRWSS